MLRRLLFAASMIALLSTPFLIAQDRDMGAERMVLDDNGNDGALHTLTIDPDDLGQNTTLIIPDPGSSTATLLFIGGGTSSTAWLLGGNSNATTAGDFLGTTNANPMRILVNSGADNSLILNTNGSIQRDAGGNARGANAVDLQIVRSGAAQVASGAGATIGGGSRNIASASEATVGGGFGNVASGVQAAVGGGNGNNAQGDRAAIGGGNGNAASGTEAVIGGGAVNIALADYTTIGGGISNNASADEATIGGGSFNAASGVQSTVGGGQNNNAQGLRNTIGGGIDNRTFDANSTVGGGSGNTARAFGTVAGGSDNLATSYGAVGGGTGNSTGHAGVVGGGFANTVGVSSAIPGGRGLTVRDRSFGFLANTSTPPFQTGPGDRPMEIQAGIHEIALFGNADLWLANNNNDASQIRFYEANATTGVFPNGTNYTSFEAGPQTANINYILPTSTAATTTVEDGVLQHDAGTGQLSWVDPTVAANAWNLDGNAGTTPGTDFVGTSDAQALHILVNGGADNSLILNTNGSIQRDAGGDPRGADAVDLQRDRNVATQVGAGPNSVISGGERNAITSGSAASTIGGGTSNSVTNGANRATIAGGINNTVNSFAGTIAGGENNTVGFLASVGGGRSNIANNNAATIAGGFQNNADGGFGSVGGGAGNTTRAYGAIPGGRGLSILSGSFGFLGNNPGDPNVSAIGNNPMTIEPGNNNIAIFGNTDMWLANNDGAASQIRFYEAYGTPGAFPNGTNFTSFEAGAQTADISYVLPTIAPTAGQVLQSDASGNLSWAVAGSGGAAFNRVRIDDTDSPYAPSPVSCVIGVDVSTAAVTINLPDADQYANGEILIINVEEGNAGTNNVTINASAGDTFDGAAGPTTLTITFGQGQFRMYSDGANGWYTY